LTIGAGGFFREHFDRLRRRQVLVGTRRRRHARSHFLRQVQAGGARQRHELGVVEQSARFAGVPPLDRNPGRRLVDPAIQVIAQEVVPLARLVLRPRARTLERSLVIVTAESLD
jgi:hypothetical protein